MRPIASRLLSRCVITIMMTALAFKVPKLAS